MLVVLVPSFFGGYARDHKNNTNYALQSKKVVLNQAYLLQGVEFHSVSYDQLEIPPNSIIYCDPPYAKVTGYRPKFDSAKFWDWCDKMVEDNHLVFVSEYEAPSHWVSIFEKSITVTIAKDTGYHQAQEKLFIRAV